MQAFGPHMRSSTPFCSNKVIINLFDTCTWNSMEFYPLKYPTLFLGMVEYNELSVRRQLALAVYMFCLFRGKINSPELFRMISFYVPDHYAERRRWPRLLVKPCCGRCRSLTPYAFLRIHKGCSMLWLVIILLKYFCVYYRIRYL